MWISKKKWEALEKRVANLEREVQGQITQTPEVTADRLKKNSFRTDFSEFF